MKRWPGAFTESVGTLSRRTERPVALFEVRQYRRGSAARRHQHRCEVLTLERVRANAIRGQRSQRRKAMSFPIPS